MSYRDKVWLNLLFLNPRVNTRLRKSTLLSDLINFITFKLLIKLSKPAAPYDLFSNSDIYGDKIALTTQHPSTFHLRRNLRNLPEDLITASKSLRWTDISMIKQSWFKGWEINFPSNSILTSTKSFHSAFRITLIFKPADSISLSSSSITLIFKPADSISLSSSSITLIFKPADSISLSSSPTRTSRS